MRGILCVVMITVWVASFGSGCSKDESKKTSPYASIEPKVGNPAVDFLYNDMNGAPFRLTEERGHAVIIYFWRMRCKECKQELSSLEALYRAHKDKGLVVVAVDADTMHSGPIEDVTAFISKGGFTFLNLRDDTGYVSEAFAVLRAPMAFIIDKNGVIAAIKTDKTDWTSVESSALIEPLLK